MYYIDFAAGTNEAKTKQALEKLNIYANNVRILGSYKAGHTLTA
jgi:prephenate dehydratase